MLKFDVKIQHELYFMGETGRKKKHASKLMFHLRLFNPEVNLP